MPQLYLDFQPIWPQTQILTPFHWNHILSYLQYQSSSNETRTTSNLYLVACHNISFTSWKWCSPCNLGGIVPRVSFSNSIDFIWYLPIYSAKIGSDVLLIIPQIACKGNKIRLHYLGMLIYFKPFPWNDMSQILSEEFAITLSR